MPVKFPWPRAALTHEGARGYVYCVPKRKTHGVEVCEFKIWGVLLQCAVPWALGLGQCSWERECWRRKALKLWDVTVDRERGQ